MEDGERRHESRRRERVSERAYRVRDRHGQAGLGQREKIEFPFCLLHALDFRADVF